MNIRRLRPEEWSVYRSIRLRALADAPDAFGSTLAREETFADNVWQKRLDAGARSALQLPIVAEDAAEPVGLAWGRIEEAEPHVATLYQMWVAPHCRGQGVGSALVHAVITWAKNANAHALVLSVTAGNSAAYQLYAGLGFIASGPLEPLRRDSSVLAQTMQLDLRGAG